jgi:hypothetical protein
VSDEIAADGDAEDPAAGEPSPVQRALDLFVFAPFGMVLTAVEDLPGLVAKGRERIETEVRNARVVGEFVVTQGQQEITTRVGKLFNGSSPEAGEADGPGDDGPAPTPSAPAETAAAKPEPDPADAVIVEGALAGYDTLSASQVVRRLESLGAEELRAVYRHEASHRSRRTILNRTSQLLEDSP